MLSRICRSAHIVRRLAVVLLVVAVPVAGFGCASSDPLVLASVASVTLSGAAVSVRVGDDAPLTATPRGVDGQPVTGRQLFWSVRDTSIATVTQAGLVHGVAPGTTQVAANIEGQSAVATVTVLARPVVALTVDPATAQLVAGTTQRLAARATNDRGAAVTTPVVWTSLAPGIVTVSADGLVTAVSPGVGSVRASVDSLSATAVVVVTPVPVASVRVAPATASVVVGGTQQLAATALDAGGAALAGRTVAWTSQTPAVASVSSGGLVTGLAPGTATVAATIEGQTATATVTVRLAPVATVTVSPSTSSITVGTTLAFTATPADANGTALTGRNVAWGSSATGVATVDQSGVVTGVAAGTATISANSEGVTGTATVTVLAPPPATVASVTVSPPSASIVAGTSLLLTATPRTSNGTVVTGRTVTWASSAAGVATVNASGVVTAVAVGTTNISATVDGITGTATISVQRAPVASVVVTPAIATVPASGTLQLTAVTRDAQGNALAGRVVTWTSSNTAAATVTSAGLVVAGSAPGTATITASSEGVNGTSTITIAAVVRVSPTTAAIRVAGPPSGRTVQLVATDQTNRVLGPSEVTWSTSNAAVATVSTNGLVTSVSAPGGSATAVITVTYSGATATATITVTP